MLIIGFVSVETHLIVILYEIIWLTDVTGAVELVILHVLLRLIPTSTALPVTSTAAFIITL